MKDNIIGERELKNLINKKKILLGTKQAKKSLKRGEAETIIVTEDRKEIFKDVENKFIFKGNPKELGQLCGKPFNISVITVVRVSK